MTPKQEQMFQLQDTAGPTVNIPGQVVQAGVESVEIDEVSHGLAQTVQYMARNGPTRPTQRARAKVMTRQQLEEQKMNESAGLPSNLDEATRVLNLESQVSQINENLGKLASVMTQLVQGQPAAPPPTPQARPVVEQRPLLINRAPNPLPTCPPPAPVTAQTTPVPEVPESPPATSPPASQPQVSPGTVPDPHLDRFEVIQEEESGESEPSSFRTMLESGDTNASDFTTNLIKEEPAIDPAEEKFLERQQILADQVTGWLKSKDSNKFWRQFIAGACNKNLSYNTWPVKMQVQFDQRFNQMIADGSFIATLCGRVLKFQNGHLVAPHVMGAFVVATAGFLSFALLEV